LCGLLLGATPASAATSTSKSADAKKELNELKSRIDAIQKNLEQAESSRNDASDALEASERAISDANRALSELGQKSQSAHAKVAEIKRETARAENALSAQRKALSKMLYQQYVTGRPEGIAILLNGRDPNEMARELHYLSYVGRARAKLIASLEENMTRLADLEKAAAQEAAELAAIAAEHTRQRQKLETEKRSRKTILARISRDIERQRREIGTLRQDEARLTRLIEQLARAIARTPKPRARTERERASPPRVRNERVPELTEELDGAFAKLRGRLALPVRGELANRFGSPRQDGAMAWKGLFIAAPGGEAVRAIAGGRVVFADWLRGFGNLLIIDHGDSYMSLYGYNETLYKQVGDVIRGGDRIAAVGNTGGRQDSGLYFELRHEGRPFDPMTWVSVR
jgi:septal ring factor EnvC (AmiA/AmiB activator)